MRIFHDLRGERIYDYERSKIFVKKSKKIHYFSRGEPILTIYGSMYAEMNGDSRKVLRFAIIVICILL